jgi:2-polyprenyl-3-methyl-5-hydroxy-6-metoxy-1,4-benzoquinol methylase
VAERPRVPSSAYASAYSDHDAPEGFALDASPCAACGTVACVPVTRETRGYRVVACARCGLGRTEPRPDAAALRGLYAGDYLSMTARKFSSLIEAARRACARALARRIARRAGPPRRALDIGCGDGKLLVALAARGFRCTGTELNARVGDVVPPGSGITTHVGPLAAARLPAASFQVVILRHVLEHLDDPIAALGEVRRIIEPDGHLVIAVPNVASWQARSMREHWFHLDLPRHLHHFTPSTLLAMLETCGFRVDQVSHFSIEQNPYGWLQSIVHAAGGGHQVLYDQLRAPGAATASRPRIGALIGAGVLAPFCIALAAIESAARAGGSIEVWASPV